MQCLWRQWLYIAHAAAWLVSLASRAQENGERVRCHPKPKQPNEWPKVYEYKKSSMLTFSKCTEKLPMLWRKFTRRYGWKLGRLARCADVFQRSAHFYSFRLKKNVKKGGDEDSRAVIRRRREERISKAHPTYLQLSQRRRLESWATLKVMLRCGSMSFWKKIEL